jgi:hypothetical protein
MLRQRRADAGLRELPEYPTTPPKSNANRQNTTTNDYQYAVQVYEMTSPAFNVPPGA